MTKEEREKAIDLLDNLIGMIEDNQKNDYDKALRMGIESLRKEPSTDAVSRSEIQQKINRLWNSNGDKDYCMETLKDFVTELQPVTPAVCIAKVNFSKEDIQALDKIRAEIEQITDTMGVSYNQYVSKIDVLQIIDKYRNGE